MVLFAGMDFHELLDIPQRYRRKYHDDVTVMVVSLGRKNLEVIRKVPVEPSKTSDLYTSEVAVSIFNSSSLQAVSEVNDPFFLGLISIFRCTA